MSRRNLDRLTMPQRAVLNSMIQDPRLDLLGAILRLDDPPRPHTYRAWVNEPLFEVELAKVERFQQTVLRQQAAAAGCPAPPAATASVAPSVQRPAAATRPAKPTPTHEPAPNLGPFSRAEMAEIMRRKPRED